MTEPSKRRHRFIRMNERLDNLQTELQLHGKTNATEVSLTFQEELALQGELTMIESFQILYRKLQPLTTTTPQLLHHLAKVVALLQRELQQEKSADVQKERVSPVLKLLTALARELRKEFYPHFSGILPDIVAIIDTKDPELSTQVFKTLTMMFNFLRVQILKDMEAVHKCYFPLLGHPKPFVRDFAAQTLSILLRRVDSSKDLKKYLSTYLKALTRGSGKDNEILQDGSAKLFFALIRNVNHGFHSRMGEIFLFLLGSFRPKETSTDDQLAVVYEIVRLTCDLMTKHTDAENAGEMLDCFALALNKLIATTKRENDADCLYLSRMLHMFAFFVRYRGGRMIAQDKQVKMVHKICVQLLSDAALLSSVNELLRNEIVQLFEGVWRLFPDKTSVVAAQVKTVFSCASAASASDDVKAFWRTRLLQLAEQIFTHTMVEVDFIRVHVFPNALAFAFETLLHVDVGAFAILLNTIGVYVSTHEDVADENPFIVYANDHRFLTYAPSQKQRATDATLLRLANKLSAECFHQASKSDTEKRAALAVAWKFCKALALMRMDDDQVLEFVKPAIARVESELAKMDPHAELAAEFGAFRSELWRLMQIADHQKKKAQAKPAKLSSTFVVEALTGKQSSFATLSAFLEFVQMKTEAQQHELLGKDALAPVAHLLQANLRSRSHELRLVSLEILVRHDRFEYIEAGDVTLMGKCDLLDVCLSLERLTLKVSVEMERELIRLIGRVKILCRSPQTPTVYKLIAVNHLLGLYHVKFATIWPHIADAVEAAARVHFAEVWSIITPELLAASVRQEEKPASHSSSCASDEEANAKSSTNLVQDEFRAVCALEKGQINPASVTDLGTHHSMLWKGLEKFVDLVETKTRFIVPLFLVFLRDQYASIYADELETTIVDGIDQAVAKLVGAASSSTDAAEVVAQWQVKQTYPQLTTKTVRGKFLDQLKLFAAFKNMKGAYANALLHEFFFDLIMKSDEVISKLALQCLFCFGKKHLSAYKDQLNRIADSTTFREELTVFNISEESGIVLNEHRPHLLPVLMRLLYSKCVSKKGRNTGDTVAARRSAILSYLAALEESELASFVELVVRAFDVKIVPPATTQHHGRPAPRREHVEAIALENVQPSRVLGFLNLLEDLVGQIGTKLAAYVPPIADLLVSILQVNVDSADAAAMDVDEENKDDDDDAEDAKKPEYSASMRKQIRMLAYRRLAEIVDTFDHVVVLQPWVNALLEISHDAIAHLPNAVVGASKASALLDFLVALARGSVSRTHLTAPLIASVISCLSAGLESSDKDASPARGLSPEILDSVLQFLGSLLDGDESRMETDSEEAPSPDAQQLVIPQIPFILDQFVARFHAKTARYAQERYAGSSKKELVFLCRLSTHIGAASSELSSKSAHDLFQLLLPFLLRNHHPSPADMENILQVLTQLVPQLSEPKKHVLSLSKLLAPGPNCITDRAARSKLIGVFLAMGRHRTLTALARVGELLVDLNAYDAKKIEEIDFERRVDALNAVNNSAFAGFLDDSHLLAPLISQYLQSMHDGEFSIRSGALAGLTTFIRLVAHAVDANAELAEKSAILNALESLVMPCVRVSLKSPSEDIRRGFVMFLGNLSDHHSSLRRFAFVHADLALLRNKEDPEADFFYNITHIQAHRKRRALQRVGSLMDQMALKVRDKELAASEDAMDVDSSSSTSSAEWFTNSTVNNIILPLVLHFIYEAQAKSQESIRTEAAGCVGSAAGLLGWSHYLALLRRLLKSIDGHDEMENTIILAICSAIDHFHYPAPGAITEWDGMIAKQRKPADKATAIAEGEDAAGASKIQDSMEAQVLPMLKRYLFKGVTKKGKEKAATANFDDDAVSSQQVTVRVPLALAIVKVLRRLRAATFYLEFPKLLMSFAKLLKAKDEAIRTSARTTLVRITMELGITYLLPVVEELKATLRDGYMIHVLSYTLHSLLEKASTMLEAKKPRSLAADAQEDADGDEEADFASPLDACIPSIMDILVEDLFRGVVENQDGSAEHKSKMKEAKSSRSLDALELLARSVTFLPNPSIHAVVAALVRKFRETENAKSTLVLHESLKRIALGLVKNPSVEKSYVFLYVYNLLHSCLESLRPSTELEKAKYKQAAAANSLVSTWLVGEKSKAATAELAKRVHKRETAKVTMQMRMTGYDRRQLQDEVDSITHLEELLNFSVFLVYAFLRTGDISPSLVDPLVPHLMRCASEVKNNKAVVNALKSLTVLLNHHDIPSMDVALAPLVDRLFKIIQKAGAATRNEMVQTCYRTLTVILKQRTEYRLTEPQLRVLLSFVRADLEEKDHQNATYALLKSIIASRLVIPEVYDVMLRVGELLVQSDAQSARANCSSIYLTFLLEYPLGPKRITHHLKFLMNNLSYTYESGRKSVLDALAALLKKLPLDILNERAQFFLLPLVLRVANDESAVCRALASDAIKTLIKRIGNHQLNESVLLVGKWWSTQQPGSSSSDTKLLCTAAQVTGLVLESRPEFLDKSAMDVFKHARVALTKRLDDMDNVEDSAEMDWQVVYHILVCLTKFGEHLAGKLESWLAEGGSSFLDDVVLPLLEYPHAWVRLAALRFVNSYLRRRSATTLLFLQPIKKLSKEVTGDRYLKQPGKLFAIAGSIAKLFEKPEFTAEVADEALFAMPFLIGALETFSSIPQYVSSSALPDASAREDAAVEAESEENQVGDDDDEGGTNGSDSEDEDEPETSTGVETTITDEQEQEDAQAKAKTPIGWILTRFSYLSRAVSGVVRVTIFKLFAALIKEHDAAFVERYLMQMLNPLFRAAATIKEQQNPSEGSLLAQEVLELLEAKIGATPFLDAYTFVQKKLSVFRATRKEKRKRDLINDPQLAAKRKIQKNEQKRRAKQFKKRKYTVMKGSASAATKARKVMRPGAE